MACRAPNVTELVVSDRKALTFSLITATNPRVPVNARATSDATKR